MQDFVVQLFLQKMKLWLVITLRKSFNINVEIVIILRINCPTDKH